MLRILEPQVVSNLADGLVGTCYHLLGGINQFVLDVFLRGLPRLFLNQVSEIIGREKDLVGKILHGRKSFGLRCVSLEISVEQCFEYGC